MLSFQKLHTICHSSPASKQRVPQPRSCKSPMAIKIIDANHHFLSRVLNSPHPLPEHSPFVASCPARKGGVGPRDPVANAIASYVILLSRSTHCSLHGISLRHERTLFLLTHCTNSLHSNWKSETLRMFKILRLYLPPSLQCPCGKTPVVHGDHFFHCKSASGHRTMLCDKMRDRDSFSFSTLLALSQDGQPMKLMLHANQHSF